MKSRREEYEFLKKELLSKMEIISNQCRSKLEEMHREKLEYTKKLYAQFEVIRVGSEERYDLLEGKYYELEMLFEERPSRG